MTEPSNSVHDPASRPSVFRSRSLYVNIVTVFVSLLAVSLWCVVFFNYRSNSRVVLRLSDDLMSRVSEAVVERTRAYLQPAAVLIEMSVGLAERGAIPIEPTEELDRYALEALRAHPQVLQFYVGDELGSYLMPTRQPDGTIATWIIDRRVSPMAVTWKYRDAALRVIRTEKTADDPYDPRKRPWYGGAKKTGGLFWTDVYVFYTGGQPGITCAKPVLNADGACRAVFAADIPLGDISRFLQTLQIAKGGFAVMVDESGNVIAFPDLARTVVQEGKEMRSARVEELGVPSVVAAFAEQRRTGALKGVVSAGGERFVYSVRDLSGLFHRPWQFATVVPENELVGALKEANRVALWIGLAVLATSVALAAFLARSISRPITQLAAEASRIREFHLHGTTDIHSSIKEIQLMSRSFAAMKSGLLAFRKYVPAELVRQLIQTGDEARLGGNRRELTIFFSDIEGFTPLSEGMTPEALMVHLSEYLDEVTKIILAQQGTIDKYIGDAVMAFWGAPLPDVLHARHACEAALQCQERITALNDQWRRAGRTPLPTRIGIHTGETIVGNVGSSERLNYTVIGDSVNLASRLEGANKFFGTRILVSQATFDLVATEFVARPIAILAVKGRTDGIAVHELLARKSDPRSAEWEPVGREFARGIAAYRRREWNAALAIFRDLAASHSDDRPARFYQDRCADFLRNPPGVDWQPIEVLQSK